MVSDELAPKMTDKDRGFTGCHKNERHEGNYVRAGSSNAFVDQACSSKPMRLQVEAVVEIACANGLHLCTVTAAAVVEREG